MRMCPCNVYTFGADRQCERFASRGRYFDTVPAATLLLIGFTPMTAQLWPSLIVQSTSRKTGAAMLESPNRYTLDLGMYTRMSPSAGAV